MIEDRMHAVDSGRGITNRGVDQGTMRMTYNCSATCCCNATFVASSLARLRDQLACHVIDCGGVPEG